MRKAFILFVMDYLNLILTLIQKIKMNSSGLIMSEVLRIMTAKDFMMFRAVIVSKVI